MAETPSPISLKDRLLQVPTKITGFARRIRSGISEVLRRGKERQTPKELELYISQGLDLIRIQSYQDALTHFRNANSAQILGFEIMPAQTFFLPSDPQPRHIKHYADLFASSSRVKAVGGEVYAIQIAGIEKSLDSSQQNPLVLPIPLLHNMALVGAEEWIHVMQHRQKPHAPVKKNEIDVADYLLTRKVPLTPEFLDRYDRRAALHAKYPTLVPAKTS